MKGSPAGFGRRALAHLVDGFILSAVGLTLNFSFNFNSQAQQGSGSYFVSLTSILLSAAYYIFFWVKQDGQTIGKRAMAVRVIRQDGRPLDVATGVIRYLGYLVSGFFLGLGYLWIIFDKKKRGWHDRLAKTLVVKTGQKPKTGLIIAILLIAILLFVLFFGLLGFGFYSLFKESPQEGREAFRQLQEGFEEGFGQYGSEFGQSEANELALDVTHQVNQFRKANNLPAFISDSRLCAYAQRRLEQLSELGRFDDHKGFFEDTNNSQINQTYFSSYLSFGEAGYSPLTSLTLSSQIVDYWNVCDQDEKALLCSRAYDYACVRASPEFLMIIAGDHK